MGGYNHVIIEVRRLQKLGNQLDEKMRNATPTELPILRIQRIMLTNQISLITARLKEQEWSVIPR